MSLNPQESIDILNLARSMELVAIGQYMQHHYVLDNLMFPTLAKAVKKIAISEMRHAEMLSERIRELGGIPIVAPAQLLKKIIVEEEGHSQYFQDVVDHLTQLGPHYLAVQAGGAFDKTDYEKFIIG